MIVKIITALFLLGIVPLLTGCGPFCICKEQPAKKEAATAKTKRLDFTASGEATKSKLDGNTQDATLTTPKRTPKARGAGPEIRSEAEFNEAKQGPCVVLFDADWCAACKHIDPIFENVARKYDKKYTFLHVNVDDFRALATLTYGLDRIPGILFFNKGKELTSVGRLMGSTTTNDDLINKIKEAFEEQL